MARRGVRGPLEERASRGKTRKRDRARLPGGSGINPRERHERRARRSEERAVAGVRQGAVVRRGAAVARDGGRREAASLRDSRRAAVGIEGRSTQARLATERLRAATLSLVRRNPVSDIRAITLSTVLKIHRSCPRRARCHTPVIDNGSPTRRRRSPTRVRRREGKRKKKKRKYRRKSGVAGGKFREHAARRANG